MNLNKCIFDNGTNDKLYCISSVPPDMSGLHNGKPILRHIEFNDIRRNQQKTKEGSDQHGSICTSGNSLSVGCGGERKQRHDHIVVHK